MSTSELYTNQNQPIYANNTGEVIESEDAALYRARVRALLIIDPNIRAGELYDKLEDFYLYEANSELPMDWLEVAAEEKQKLQRQALIGRDILLTPPPIKAVR